MEEYKKQLVKKLSKPGSAMVLTVVLTVLLALIGSVFVLVSRIDDMSTSTIVQDHELNSAVDSIVTQINTVLIQDLFGTKLSDGIIDSNSINEPYDYPSNSDKWLASLEPTLWDDFGTPYDATDDTFRWERLSDIYAWGDMGRPYFRFPSECVFVPAYQNENQVDPYQDFYPQADADGDGVSDSFWCIVPNLNTSKGERVYAAVRIIDNCGMLNLNTAHTKETSSDGRYLSNVDYESFLRGKESTPEIPEDIFNIRKARMAEETFNPLVNTAEEYHHEVIMNIDNPGSKYALFDISDELEIRNRYLLTSKMIARFERADIAHYTFDAGGGIYGALSIPRDNSNMEMWNWRMDNRNFDDSDLLNPNYYKYDRRHVCTFYSFARNVSVGKYSFLTGKSEEITKVFKPLGAPTVNIGTPYWDSGDGEYKYDYNNEQTRKRIVHLLYGFREYFMIEEGLSKADAAVRSAQYVANIIDYSDDNNPVSEGPFFDARFGDGTTGQSNEDVTYINRDIVRELVLEASADTIDIDADIEYDLGLDATDTVYGIERQPFIAELYCEWDGAVGGAQAFGIELLNPYRNPNGQIDLDGWRIRIGNDNYDLDSNFYVPEADSTGPGTIVIWGANIGYSVPQSGYEVEITSFGLGLSIDPNDVLELQRPDPANPGGYITVDKLLEEQLTYIRTDGIHVSARDDDEWMFTDAGTYDLNSDPTTASLGSDNSWTSGSGKNWQIPIPDDNVSIGTLLDFEKVLSVGNQAGTDPNTFTELIGKSSAQSEVRFDIEEPELLGYVSLMNRPEGTLPGRININTATKEVIQAAIPPSGSGLWEPDVLAQAVVDNRPFESLGELLDLNEWRALADDPNEQVGDTLLADDFEERDWILSRIANVFTVRSDVFTAYILVRLGAEGPQRRMIAIFDRSNVYKPTDKPELVALHPVPDPR